jgi:S1-C subfamily serine protease
MLHAEPFMRDLDLFEDDEIEGEFEQPENRDGLMLGIFLGAGLGILLLAAGIFFFVFQPDEQAPNVAQQGHDGQVDQLAQNDPKNPQPQPVQGNNDGVNNVVANNNVQPDQVQPDQVQPKQVKPKQPVADPIVKPAPEVKPDPVVRPEPDAKPAPAVEPAPAVKPAPEVKPAPKVLKPGIPGQRIAYAWNAGEIHSYQMEMVADRGNVKQTMTGSIELTVNSTAKPKNAPKKIESAQGSGTGFVATPDGYIVTCAHVVRDATKIEVHLNGKRYGATVVATEPNDDLAVLKIDAKDLTVISLAKASEVQLAQEIRNIGYPLSNVLGEGLKITAGVISGVVQRDGRKRFQIDAAVNPGNSGGPVVNLRGEVVGVASSKLVGLEVDKVGFCVPSDAVETFLKKHKISALINQGAKQDLDGPTLFQTAKPTLALIKVTINPNRSLGKLMLISTSGNYRTKLDQPGRRVIGLGGTYVSTRGSLKVDQFGQVEEFNDSNQLPYLTGPMSLLAVHELDPDGRNQWTVRQGITIAIEQEDRRFGGIRRRPFGPRFRGPDPFGRNADNTKKIQAIEETNYVLKEKTDQSLVIGKRFSLKTQDDPNNPLMAITGDGTITFNRQDGMVESYEFKQTYSGQADGKRVVVPITISMTRMSNEELADRIRKTADSVALSEAQQIDKAKNVVQKTDVEKLDEILNKIKEAVAKNRSPWVDLGTLTKLAVVPERKEEVAALLVGLLATKDRTRLQYTLNALGKWGTKTSVPDIIPHLKDTFFTIPQAAANALGAIGDERAIDPLFEAVKANGRNRRYLASGLAKFGPQIEDRAIELLSSEDKDIMQSALEILKVVGGKKSIEAITPIVKGQDFFRRVYAERAIKPIQARVDLIGDTPDDPNTSPVVRRVDALIAKLQQEGMTDLQRIQTLNQLLGEKVVEDRKLAVEKELIRMLASDNASLKLQSVLAIKKWATKASIPALTKLALAGEAISVNALDALTNVADASISDQVAELILKPKTQAVAIVLLRKIGLNEKAEAQLSDALAKADVTTKARIIDILGLHGSSACLKSLPQTSQQSRCEPQQRPQQESDSGVIPSAQQPHS